MSEHIKPGSTPEAIRKLLAQMETQEEAKSFGVSFQEPEFDMTSEGGISVPFTLTRSDGFNVTSLDRWLDSLTAEIEQKTGEFVYFWLVPDRDEESQAA